LQTLEQRLMPCALQLRTSPSNCRARRLCVGRGRTHACSPGLAAAGLSRALTILLLTLRRCTEKVDIYSLGVCLWEIVTQVRRLPLSGCRT